MKLWLRKFVGMKPIVQMERKVERQTEKEVGNQMKNNKVEHGGNINRLDDERIKSAYLQQKRQQDSGNKDFGPKKTI